MYVYLICPVRFSTVDLTRQVARWESQGIKVHFPPRDVDQDDPTGGLRICQEHLDAMKKADEVWVVWDSESKGSHFDLGMAFALDKPVVWKANLQPDTEGKSYLKVIKALSGMV